MLLTTDGSWIAGRLRKIDADQVVWEPVYGEPLRIARPLVRALVFRPSSRFTDWMQMEQRILNSVGSDDEILVDESGWLQCILNLSGPSRVLLDNDQSEPELSLTKQGRLSSIELARVQAIVFSPALTPMQIERSPKALVGLRDGSLLHVSKWTITSQKSLIFQLGIPIDWTSQESMREFVDRIVFLQQSPLGVRFLGEEAPANYRHVPQWGATLPLGRDLNLYHEPLSHRNRTLLRGLAMSASAQTAYRLDAATAGTFVAELTLADPQPEAHRNLGSVIAKVLVSREGPLEIIYTSPVIRHSDLSIPVSVNLAGCRALVLLVESADRGDAGDQLLWLDARVEPR